MSAPVARSESVTARPSSSLEIVSAVTAADMMDVIEIRRRVFAEEQHVADLRVSDPDDRRSVIALARVTTCDDRRPGRRPAATGRLTPPLARGGQALIAWVATIPELRGQGIGSELMRFLLRKADEVGTREVALAAQAHAEAFYRRLGFSVAGPYYDVRGIQHVRMVRRRESAR